MALRVILLADTLLKRVWRMGDAGRDFGSAGDDDDEDIDAVPSSMRCVCEADSTTLLSMHTVLCE